MALSPRRSSTKSKALLSALIASTMPLLAPGVAQADVITRGFEGGSQLINCALVNCNV